MVALLTDKQAPETEGPDLFIAALGEPADRASFKWAEVLRKAGIWVELDYASRGLKSQMKKAGRLGAKKVLIVGDDELNSGRGILRDMLTKEQVEVDLKEVVEVIKGIFSV